MSPPALPMPPPAHFALLPAARETLTGVRVLAGVPYAAIPGIRPLELDLWLPPVGAEDGTHPAVVFVHGGGWRVGSRHSAGPAYATAQPSLFEQIAAAGIAVASVDYRLSGEALWPAQINDVKAAVRWLRNRSADVGINPDRIATWGESAGGQLAELLGLTGGNTELEGDVGIAGPSSAVAAVVAWYAPSDVRAVVTDLGGDAMDPATREAQLLGGPPPTVPTEASQASPISHVATSTTASVPPFLLLHGAADTLVPHVQSERLTAALAGIGAEVELHLYDGANHMWLGSPDAAADAVTRTIAFLQHQLETPSTTAARTNSKGDNA